MKVRGGVFEVCKSLVDSRERRRLRGKVGVLGVGGALKPTLDHKGDEGEGRSVNTTRGVQPPSCSCSGRERRVM